MIAGTDAGQDERGGGPRCEGLPAVGPRHALHVELNQTQKLPHGCMLKLVSEIIKLAVVADTAAAALLSFSGHTKNTLPPWALHSAPPWTKT